MHQYLSQVLYYVWKGDLIDPIQTVFYNVTMFLNAKNPTWPRSEYGLLLPPDDVQMMAETLCHGSVLISK